MRPFRRRSTTSIIFLALLCLCAAAPIILIPFFLQFFPSSEQKEFVTGTSDSLKNLSHWQSAEYLNSINREVATEIKEPYGAAYADRDQPVDINGNRSSSWNHPGYSSANVVFIKPLRKSGGGIGAQKHNETSSSGISKHSPKKGTLKDEKIRHMADQLITARAYLHFAQPSSNSHLVRELKLRIKELERVLSHARKDSDLHRSALQKMKAMDNTLYKTNKAYPDCSVMESNLRAMSYKAEKQLRAQMNQVSFLTQLASQTFPKGLHCLTMRLTTEYFALPLEKRRLPYSQNFQKSDLYHYAIFSDNILACAVVVNSAIANSMEQDKIVIHVVTDSLNFPAMVMWFLMSPPIKATIQMLNMDEFKWLPSNHGSMFGQHGKPHQRRDLSRLTYLHFYFPKLFRSLNKILFLDQDVVVQKDLQRLWSLDMGGKVAGVVEKCSTNGSSKPLKLLFNFNESPSATMFGPNECVEAFGMSFFDLRAWRSQNLLKMFDKRLQVGLRKQMWKAASLPLNRLVFYNHTIALDHKWLLSGLGHDSTLNKVDIESAAVIHFSGLLKPWLEIAIPKYRAYWDKFLNYDHPYLQQCNIHPF